MSLANANEHRPPPLSVVVCTHNPDAGRLGRTLDGLRAQSLPMGQWELLLVDNASNPPLSGEWDLSWHPAGRIVTEPQTGLTPARLAGIDAAAGKIIVFVDDDNVLDEGYLAAALEEMEGRPEVGAAGGRSQPEYETTPPEWVTGLEHLLACRDLGGEPLVESWRDVPPGERVYPAISPIGAGMVIRREPCLRYAERLSRDARRKGLDRAGGSLASGGDNDLVMTVLEEGWSVAYLPRLCLTHLIPGGRVRPAYLEKLAREMTRSWVSVLDIHGIRPWQPVPRWAVPLLKAKYYATSGAWRGPRERVVWQSACGQAEGRSLLSR